MSDEMVLIRVQRCHYCRREMANNPLEYAENPFCTQCLEERMAAAAPPGGVTWRKEGNYLIPEAAQTPP
jgi:hypothetical protein